MFGTSARVAADESQPLNRRLTNLSNAIEKFRLLGFHWTFDQLYKATGASPGAWTSEQLSVAAGLLMNAHDSWITCLRETQRDTRRRKRTEPGYKPLERRELFRRVARSLLRCDPLQGMGTVRTGEQRNRHD